MYYCILSKNHRNSNNITLEDNDGHDVSSPLDVSNSFSEHFSTIADRLDADIPRMHTDPMYNMPDPLPSSFTPSPANVLEVIIISLQQITPCNVNTIPVFIFKRLAHQTASIICHISSSSITNGIFPAVLKLPKIILLHKGKSDKVLGNFRPISLLPLLLKVFEKLSKTGVTNFLSVYNILFDKQLGFRKVLSTSDAILHLVDDVATALDNKLYTITIFLDFSKAFLLCIFHSYVHNVNQNHFHVKFCNLIPEHNHRTRFSIGFNYLYPMYHKSDSQNQFL